MSQYISSFLIDPVVRQARRFSRPADDSPHLVPRPTFEGNEAVSEQETLSEASTDGHETFPPLSLSEDDLAASAFIDNHEVGPPTASRRLENEPPQVWENEQTDQTLTSDSWIGRDYAESEVNEQRNNLPGIDTTSQNPISGVHNGLRSTASSISNSARSLVDATMSPVDTSLGDGQDSRSRGGSGSSRSVDGSLPADDGMSDMRKRIKAIQRTDSSNEVKARLVHGLMTEKHNSSQQNLLAPRAQSPGSMHSSDRPFTPSSPKSMSSLRQTISPPASSSSNAEPSDSFQLSPEDLRPTYRQDEDLAESEQDSKSLGCEHYKRNIKLQCSACHKWYTCRFCHDAVEDHMLNRRETKNMLCMFCGSAQPASGQCTHCSEPAACYYCDICKLWDDSPGKNIYHCNDCGICRLGGGLGKDFFHCKTCSVCMSITIRDSHRCIERSTDCDCPICGEYMFTSPQTVVFMRCGHSIHRNCYDQHMLTSYKCPICSKSIPNMESQWLRLRQMIETQPMPSEFQDTKAWIYCNDCSAKTMVEYHWLGLCCAVCDSYNTAQLQLLSGPEAEAQLSPRLLPAPNDQNSGDAGVVSRQDLSSRSRDHNRPHQQTASAPPPAMVIAQALLEGNSWPNARLRDVPSMVLQETRLTPPASPSNGSSDPDDSMDTDEEVDFWGGESPWSRLSSPSHGHEMAVDDSEEEDDGDSEDEEMSDDDDAEDEADDNRMEIFGHR